MIREIRALTGIRGLLALRVLFDHYFENDVLKYLKKCDFICKEYVIRIIERGYLSVDFFFLLSAFVLSLVYDSKIPQELSPKDYTSFLSKRILRIYPLYLLNLALFGMVATSRFTWHHFTINLLFSQSLYEYSHIINPATWSLSVELLMYLIFPFLLIYIRRLNLNRAVLICLSLAITSYILTQYFEWSSIEKLSLTKRVEFKNNLGGAFGFTAVLRGISGFSLGLLGYRIYRSHLIVSVINKWRLPIVIVTFIAFCIDEMLLCIPFLMTLLLLILTQKNILSRICGSKVVYILGTLSFSIYLNHLVVRFAFTNVLRESALTMSQRTWLFSLETIITLLLSYWMYHFFEMPINNFIKNKVLAKPSPAPSNEPVIDPISLSSRLQRKDYSN